VDRVVAAEPQVFRMLAGASGEPLVDANGNQLRVKLLEGRESFPMLLSSETI